MLDHQLVIDKRSFAISLFLCTNGLT